MKSEYDYFLVAKKCRMEVFLLSSYEVVFLHLHTRTRGRSLPLSAPVICLYGR
jgi:hypothetical protein